MADPIYRGEAWLRHWADTPKGGRRITLQLDEEGLHPFKGYEGERFAVVIVPLGNDDQPMKKTEGVAQRTEQRNSTPPVEGSNPLNRRGNGKRLTERHMIRNTKLEDFRAGQAVRYVPYHAHGDIRHPDCENGTVTSVNDRYVFVRFKGETSQGCNPDQLVIVQ